MWRSTVNSFATVNAVTCPARSRSYCAMAASVSFFDEQFPSERGHDPCVKDPVIFFQRSLAMVLFVAQVLVGELAKRPRCSRTMPAAISRWRLSIASSASLSD